MDKHPPTQKRIKRHVISQSHTFFATTSPGLEPLCAREIADLPSDIKNVDIISGGVLFTCRLADCYAANLHLRIPNRILMRLTDFKATNFRQLDKNIMQFPWELYLSPSSELDSRSYKGKERGYNGAIHRYVHPARGGFETEAGVHDRR